MLCHRLPTTLSPLVHGGVKVVICRIGVSPFLSLLEKRTGQIISIVVYGQLTLCSLAFVCSPWKGVSTNHYKYWVGNQVHPGENGRQNRLTSFVPDLYRLRVYCVSTASELNLQPTVCKPTVSRTRACTLFLLLTPLCFKVLP